MATPQPFSCVIQALTYTTSAATSIIHLQSTLHGKKRFPVDRCFIETTFYNEQWGADIYVLVARTAAAAVPATSTTTTASTATPTAAEAATLIFTRPGLVDGQTATV